MKLGIICPSEIAYRRFMPSLKENGNFEFVGLAIASKDEWNPNGKDEDYKVFYENNLLKAKAFINDFGGKIFEGYKALITSKELDAIYIPLPPALHFKWAKMALENDLHVLLEKPFTTSLVNSEELIEIASKKSLAIHENYMFIYHSQLEEINNVVKQGIIGDIRNIRIDFGFPDRGKTDFRYDKELGGGALLDCGGYTLKYASSLLSNEAKLDTASLFSKDGYEVDIYGSATLSDDNKTIQVAFGMDNDYRCNIDIWGSKGTLTSKRVLTAPKGYAPSYEISINGEVTKYSMKEDDAFLKSINCFYNCVNNPEIRKDNYKQILKQAKLVDEFVKRVNN